MMNIKLSLVLIMLSGICMAQNSTIDYRSNLDKRISLNIKAQPVSEVLNKMSKAGGFYFSYSGKLFNQDSLVTVSVRNIAVRDFLNQLFNGKVDYKEIGEYIILRYAANHFTIEPENITSADRLYLIRGYVVDMKTGLKVKQASVYEKRLLQSTLTNDNGYFKLRFKGDHKEVVLTASKNTYRDTSLIFLSDITIKPEGYNDEDSEKANRFFNSIENSGISRFFISSKQRVQSLNIPDFFASSPFQASLIPGLSSHGIMSSQVVNKASLNVLGGYTAGIDGVEVAGLFNITKGNVKNLQIAGLFNGIGGSVDGVQVAGLLNDVRTKTDGVQIAGLLNHVNQDVEGFQAAGLGNFVLKNVKGTQVAGLANITAQATNGVQIAGLGNITSKSLKGIQIAGLVNYAKEMNGVQIGLINISDKNTGYSIGLVNYVHHGYHKISISTNEVINTNIAFKTGNANLYNIIFAGNNFSDTAKVITAGLGFGHDFIFNNKISVATELSAQYLYLGNWNHANMLNRLQVNLQFQIFKGLTVFGGPVYSAYINDAPAGSESPGYKQNIAPVNHSNLGGNAKGWVGFNAGITIM